MNRRQVILLKCLNLLTVVTTTFMIWKGLCLTTKTESPIAAVLSESMEPAFKRGDLLFLTLQDSDPIMVNNICVFKLPGRDIPIVHRVIKVHQDESGKEFILTKGDNNKVDDRTLYSKGQMWIHKEHVIGKVKGVVPYVGMATIIMSNTWLKYTAVGTFALVFFICNKE
ncbi:uncharacterized protein RHIMIDRAFT_305398 [Rhizopus microsporus ATCC 52813]|uniref:Signal peptidase complex catalytic subunit SEC11 n=1 Tax=Rhizopus microsporus ATCC 52813 TaxID=1340429 RepID=A0A2G4SXB9_RHIZD|nr:uncharacterized protein RHIMIDRAFT_305398 [Rhizopus microsporus ATCC 52813]PHZ13392.1 hypothetical protein RHIMIDRAFT_305398 [Rhizopus microsporus ATCC 52813]